MSSCAIEGCLDSRKGGRGLCGKHYTKWRKYGDPLFGKENKHRHGEGCLTSTGYWRMSNNGERKKQHLFIIEKALGKKIPPGSVTHHIDGDKLNNKNNNLILCDSIAYHSFIHLRMRALNHSGHANYRFCLYCKKWDDPKNNMFFAKSRESFHRECRNKYESNRRRTIRHRNKAVQAWEDRK